jgi:hypothetical protein
MATTSLCNPLLASIRSLNDDVCGTCAVSTVVGFGILWDGRVGFWIGVFGDDVPCVKEAGNETEDAEEDVD